MSLAVVTLKKGEGRTLKAGGAWVFDNEIANILGSYENGDIVLVHDFDGYPMGRGFINRTFQNPDPYDDPSSGPGDRRGFFTDAGKRRLGIPEKDRGHFKLPPDFR